MKAKDFRNLINRGLGSAILSLKDNPPNQNRKYLKAILHACINNSAYDPQVEGSRAEYLWEAMQLSGSSDYLQEKVLEALLVSTEPYDIEQMIHLARRFAENGNTRARDIMRQVLQYNDNWNVFIGAKDIILLEGMDGFLFVAKAIGNKILSDSSYYEDDWILTTAEEELGKDLVHSCLSKESQINPNIKAYYEGVLKFIKERESSDSKRVYETYEEIKDRIENEDPKKNIYYYVGWGIHASNEDLMKAAKDLIDGKRNIILLKYLNIFTRKPFPLNIDIIIKLVRSKNTNISRRAILALRNFEDDRIHELAISLLEESLRNYDALYLLEKNYTESDYYYLDKMILQKQNRYQFHGVGMSILKIFENNVSQNCIELLIQIYNFGWCSNCRRRAIEIMINNHVIPEWIIKECRFDSNPDIRELINSSLPI